MSYELLVLALCDRWHQLPSAVLGEDAGLLRLLDIERLTQLAQVPEGGEGYG